MQTDVLSFKLDYTIQSYVQTLVKYLQERKALDAVIIFQDEKLCEEALYNFILINPLRVILLDQLRPNVINKLKTLRPAPNYYAIVADTVNMERLYNLVSFDLLNLLNIIMGKMKFLPLMFK